MVAFFVAYIVSAEFAKPAANKGEVLVFRKNQGPRKYLKAESDVESQHSSLPLNDITEATDGGTASIAAGGSIFHWEDLCYDVSIKGDTRRILDHVDGWVKPGTSTALMVCMSA